jgi:hypothetical protein
MGSNHISKMNIFRIVWLICDFLIIWLAVYFLPSPMSDGLRGLDELPMIYNVGWLLVGLSVIYFMLWSEWKDVLIKAFIFWLVNIFTFDWTIRTVDAIFSMQMLNFIFFGAGLFWLAIFFAFMVIDRYIAMVILIFYNKVKASTAPSQ